MTTTEEIPAAVVNREAYMLGYAQGALSAIARGLLREGETPEVAAADCLAQLEYWLRHP